MRESRKSGIESAGGVSVRGGRVLAGAAAAWLWFRPSNDLSAALLSLAGLYALWRWRSALAAWRNPTGVFFGLGALWAMLSATWSFDPAGTVRDLLHAAPVALAAMAVPVIFDRPGRIWSALVVSAALVTARLGFDLIRLVSVLGWPTVLTEARFHHPYLYTHPNVSSMMAGLCALVFFSRGMAGAPGAWRKGGLALGLALDAAYVVTMASRGPQLVLAAVVFFTSESGKRLVAFGRDSWREVQKVVWPTRKETIQTTAFVFAFAVIMALFLWTTDKTLEWVFYDLILGWRG